MAKVIINSKKSNKYTKGQYFTSNVFLKNSVYNLIKNNPSTILEPSMGRGDLVEYINGKNSKIQFDLYEIDNTIDFLETINKDLINIGDFLSYDINKTYDTIIGNPPYVKTTNGNLYIWFIEKCYNLLNKNGELVFIVPSDFIKLTSSCNIINEMMTHGTFTDIIHPHNEKLFENANVDVIVFRYCKNDTLPKKLLLNNEEKYINNSNGIITFSDMISENMSLFSDYFDIYVGMVTGKEDVFKNDKYGNIEILNGKDKTDKYILIDTFPTINNSLNKYMNSNKSILINRKIKKFNENNWYEWGALRNYKTIEKKLGTKCIYISNMTRSQNVCFDDKVQYFGGSLIIMIPKQELNLKKMVEFINCDTFKNNYMYSGRFKIGHKQLCNCLFNLSDFT
jgi:adenine-specific DNA-methyltransferase